MRTFRLLVLLASQTALAGSWGLQWARGPGAGNCIDGPRIASAVEARLGRSIFVGPTDADRLVEGVLLKEAAGWRAIISVQNRQGVTLGSREHHSSEESCASLNEAVTFIIALLIDAEAPTERSEPAALDGGQPSLPAGPPPPPPVPAPPPSAHMELGGAVVPAIASAGAAGLRVEAFSLSPSGVGLEFSLEGFLPVMRREGSLGVRAVSVLTAVAVCPLSVRRVGILISPCATVSLGGLFAQGFGFDQATQTLSPLLDLGGRLRASRALTERLSLVGAIGVAVRVLRPSLGYLDAAGAPVVLLPASAVTAELAVGLSFRAW